MRYVRWIATLALSLGPSLWFADAAHAADKQPADKSAATSGALQLTVRVTDLNNDKGKVAIALFASAKDFPDQKRALQGKMSTISAGRASVVFRGLRPGLYAVAVLHDENENLKMDFNFLGMPLEGYGFSNDASGFLGPPSFADAAFRLVAPASTVSIKIRYFSL
jgi:uncharacterized protein (DUF2141 family)